MDVLGGACCGSFQTQKQEGNELVLIYCISFCFVLVLFLHICSDIPERIPPNRAGVSVVEFVPGDDSYGGGGGDSNRLQPDGTSSPPTAPIADRAMEIVPWHRQLQHTGFEEWTAAEPLIRVEMDVLLRFSLRNE